MQTKISSYDATGYKETCFAATLQRANIMHLVDLKRGGYSPRHRDAIQRLTDRRGKAHPHRLTFHRPTALPRAHSARARAKFGLNIA